MKPHVSSFCITMPSNIGNPDQNEHLFQKIENLIMGTLGFHTDCWIHLLAKCEVPNVSYGPETDQSQLTN